MSYTLPAPQQFSYFIFENIFILYPPGNTLTSTGVDLSPNSKVKINHPKSLPAGKLCLNYLHTYLCSDISLEKAALLCQTEKLEKWRIETKQLPDVYVGKTRKYRAVLLNLSEIATNIVSKHDSLLLKC